MTIEQAELEKHMSEGDDVEAEDYITAADMHAWEALAILRNYSTSITNDTCTTPRHSTNYTFFTIHN